MTDFIAHRATITAQVSVKSGTYVNAPGRCSAIAARFEQMALMVDGLDSGKIACSKETRTASLEGVLSMNDSF